MHCLSPESKSYRISRVKLGKLSLSGTWQAKKVLASLFLQNTSNHHGSLRFAGLNRPSKRDTLRSTAGLDARDYAFENRQCGTRCRSKAGSILHPDSAQLTVHAGGLHFGNQGSPWAIASTGYTVAKSHRLFLCHQIFSIDLWLIVLSLTRLGALDLSG